MWCFGGNPSIHSMFVAFSSGAEKGRFSEKASQAINVIIITPTKEIREPTEETVFQRV